MKCEKCSRRNEGKEDNMQLKPIDINDLIYRNDEETNTYLGLNDYDWMDYYLKTKFETKEQGILEVKFYYEGTVKSWMKVIQTKAGQKETHQFEYNTEIFQKYIELFLNRHMEMWKSRYPFYGEDIVIAFYNEVLGKGKEME